MTTNKNRIKVICATTYSERDYYGNCYYATSYTSVYTGRTATFKTNHESNAEGVARELCGGWNGLFRSVNSMAKRDFNRKYKDRPSLDDCNPEKAAKEIRRAWRNDKHPAR